MSELIPISLIASPHEEQAWNRQQLSVPVSEPQVRFWAYEAPGVVLGCSQSGLVSAVDAAHRAGMPLAGRQAGGGAVLVGPWMLSVSVIVPVTHPFALGGALTGYRQIGEGFAAVLRDLGIDAHAVTPEQAKSAQERDAGSSLQWACYGGLSPWEVVADGKKIVGLAQVRRRTGVLVAAGLLLSRPDWPDLCRAVGKPAGDADLLALRTTSCAEELGWEPTLPEVAIGLRRHLQETIRSSTSPDSRVFSFGNRLIQNSEADELLV